MSVTLVFHRDLSYLLKNHNESNKQSTVRTLDRIASVKDLIESQGVPHTEVGSIISNGTDKSFDYIPVNGEVIHVYPLTPPVDVEKPTFLRQNPVNEISFIVDVNVGRLAKLLRLLGFDTLYNPDWSDKELAGIAIRHNKILLTKDRELLMRKTVTWGKLIRSISPWEQLFEVILFYGLKDQIKLFSRCTSCNSLLVPVTKEKIVDQIEPLTRIMYNEFTQCPKCGKVFWRGSHHQHILEKLQNIMTIK